MRRRNEHNISVSVPFWYLNAAQDLRDSICTLLQRYFEAELIGLEEFALHGISDVNAYLIGIRSDFPGDLLVLSAIAALPRVQKMDV